MALIVPAPQALPERLRFDNYSRDKAGDTGPRVNAEELSLIGKVAQDRSIVIIDSVS